MKPAKRQFILDTAEKMFNRFSIKKTAVDEIAEKAQVAKGTIYNYFGNKDGIIREIIKDKISGFEAVLERTFSNITDPLEQIKITLIERLRILADTPFLSDKDLSHDEENTQLMMNVLDSKQKNIISDIIDQAVKKEVLPEIDKNRILNTIKFTVRGIEQSIRERLDSLSFESIELDIDYLVNLISGSTKESR